MKKLLMISLAVMACLSYSCSKDNTQKQEEEEQVKDKTPASVEFTFTYLATESMLTYSDIVVVYSDGGADKSETVTSTEWSKTVKASLPATLKFDRNVTKKEGFELLASQDYSYTKQYKLYFRILNAAGEEIDDKAWVSAVTPRTLPGDKIQLLFDGGKMSSAHSFYINEEGKCPQLEIPE